MIRYKDQTFDKWYPSGTTILRNMLPSMEEMSSLLITCVSEDVLLLKRLKDLAVGDGIGTPFSSNV